MATIENARMSSLRDKQLEEEKKALEAELEAVKKDKVRAVKKDKVRAVKEKKKK